MLIMLLRQKNHRMTKSLDTNLGQVFGRNFDGDRRKGIKKFSRHSRFLGVIPRSITRGQMSTAFYNSGVANSSEEAEELCDYVQGRRSVNVTLGSSSSFRIKAEDGNKYSLSYRSTFTGIR